MAESLRWWREEAPEGSVFRSLKRIQSDQADRIDDAVAALCLYDEFGEMGFSLGSGIVRQTDYKDSASFNVVRACVDTLRAEIIQGRPRPMFLTAGGDWSLRRKGERMGKFVEGCFSEAAFDRRASLVCLDALITGLGTIHVRECEGRASLERCLPFEVWVDRRDGLYGSPRSLYLTRWVERDVLKELYPKHEAAIAQARDELDWSWKWTDGENDPVLVVEAWHLRSSSEADDGRHVVCISTATLDEEEWTSPGFPFAFLKWKEPTAGFYPYGLASELRKIQRGLNRCSRDIADGQELHTHTKVGLPRGSRINPGHFTANKGTFVEFDGQPPVPIVFPAVSPEVYQREATLIERAFQMSGVAQSAARSEKPSGVTSGRAIRLTADLQSRRFLDFARAYEQFYVDVAKEVVRLMERLTEEDSSYEVVYRGKSRVERIVWADVKLDDGSYELQVWPTSILPSTPQGKIEAVGEMVNTGLAEMIGMSKEQIVKLLDFPDIEAAFGVATASFDLIEQTLEAMLDNGEYTPPEPFYNLDLCVSTAVRHYQKWRLDKVPEDRMELLRQWISECKALLDLAKPAPAPPPMPGEPPPDAMPAAPMPPPEMLS